MATPDEKLPPQLWKAFDGVDLILHAGDIWVPSVLDALESIAPVKAAWGDDDIKADLGSDERMVEDRVIAVDGTIVWLSHFKPPYGMIVPRENRFAYGQNTEVSYDPPSAVIFGHIHIPVIENYKGVLIVSPGSATWPEYQPRLGTVALMEIGSGNVKARIVQLG